MTGTPLLDAVLGGSLGLLLLLSVRSLIRLRQRRSNSVSSLPDIEPAGPMMERRYGTGEVDEDEFRRLRLEPEQGTCPDR